MIAIFSAGSLSWIPIQTMYEDKKNPITSPPPGIMPKIGSKPKLNLPILNLLSIRLVRYRAVEIWSFMVSLAVVM